MDKEWKIILSVTIGILSLLHASYKVNRSKEGDYDACIPKAIIDFMPSTVAMCYTLLPISLWGVLDVRNSELPR